MKGSCNCGRVKIRLARRPEYLNECDCSLCWKLGAWWGYFLAADVAIDGKVFAFKREDRAQPAIDIHFCQSCGVTTHWLPLAHIDQSRMGVNMKLFEVEALAGIELRFPDGRNWDGRPDYGFRREAIILGSISH